MACVSEIADIGLAGAGEDRIAWADAQMPVLGAIRERFAAERPLQGLRVAACLHVTAETANLVRALRAGGAEVTLCASNPLSTQDEVAAALVAGHGVVVHAVRGESVQTYARHIAVVCDTAPQLTMDDGADLVTYVHTHRTDLLDGFVGGTEDTASGVIRVRALEAEGRLAFPVMAVNETPTTGFVENRYGAGQSALDGIVRATNVLLAGRVLVVIGYGRCGQGIAQCARGAGARVVVCEVDPVRALRAHLDGLEVSPAREAAARGDILVTATGGRDALGAEHLDALRDGAILANAGHFDVEIDLAALAAAATERRRVRELVEQFTFSDGRRINLLAAGRVVNLAAAEGHPPAVMDISCAHQALAAEHLVRRGAELGPAVHVVPDAIDAQVAALTLRAMGVRIDALSEAQEAYVRSWM